MKIQTTLDELLREGRERRLYPCACAAVGRGNAELARSCCGVTNLETNTPVHFSTRFDMASVSKIMVTTIMALQALEDGRLALDQCLGDLLPDVPKDKRSITIFELLTHTSRMTPALRLDRLCRSPEEALPTILAHPLLDVPKGTVQYSCTGFITLAFLLERVFGQSLDVLARDRVFAPLGLTHTGYRPSGADFAATEKDPTTGKWLEGIVHDENARFLGGAAGNAGVFSDLDDVVRFSECLATGGAPILKEETLQTAIRNRTPGQESYRGLGFHLANHDCDDNFAGKAFSKNSFGHTGFTGTSVLIEPETGLWAVLLTNRVHPTRDNVGFGRFRIEFHDRIHTVLEEASR